MVQRLKHYDADVLTKVRERVACRFELTYIPRSSPCTLVSRYSPAKLSLTSLRSWAGAYDRRPYFSRISALHEKIRGQDRQRARLPIDVWRISKLRSFPAPCLDDSVYTPCFRLASRSWFFWHFQCFCRVVTSRRGFPVDTLRLETLLHVSASCSNRVEYNQRHLFQASDKGMFKVQHFSAGAEHVEVRQSSARRVRPP